MFQDESTFVRVTISCPKLVNNLFKRFLYWDQKMANILAIYCACDFMFCCLCKHVNGQRVF